MVFLRPHLTKMGAERRMLCFYETDFAGLYEGRYQGDTSEKAVSFVWLVLSKLENSPKQIALADAWHDEMHRGSFVFSSRPLAQEAAVCLAFIEQVWAQVGAADDKRGVLWVQNPAAITAATSIALAIEADGKTIAQSFSLPLVDLMCATLLDAAKMNLDGEQIVFGSPSGTNVKPAYITPIDMQDKNAVYRACLSFEPADLGCLTFHRWIKKKVFAQVFNPGFSWCFNDGGAMISRAMPMLLSDAEGANEAVDFCFSLYPSSIICDSDLAPLSHVEINGSASFASCYTNLYGIAFQLEVSEFMAHKGRFVFVRSWEEAAACPHRLSPAGDFFLGITGKNSDTLLCGLSGLEFFRVEPGAFLRFAAGYPAYARTFPLEAPSPFGAPFDPAADLLTSRATTSWASVGGVAQYVSQAKGFELYAAGSQTADTRLLHHEAWEIQPTPGIFYPLVPYHGVVNHEDKNPFTAKLLDAYEKTILSAIRKRAIHAVSSPLPDLGRTDHQLAQVATPSGFLVDADAQAWQRIHLAQNLTYDTAQWRKLDFVLPGVKLVQAFSSSNAFMVIVNPRELGGFSNQMNIQDWNFTFDIGKGCKYGEYRNIMIIKSRKGKLFDPINAADSLIANPQLWTQAADFSSPEDDDSQQLLLAAWLRQYVERALQKTGNRYFDAFNQMIQDANWRGILFLKVTLKRENIPAGLAGIVNGIGNMDDFVLHHFGINSSLIELGGDTLVQRKPSSLFGLIHYLHPAFDEKAQTGVEPAAGLYDFQVLSLKALFHSSAVQSLESSAQLTINSLFGLTVTKKDSRYNTILLKGSYQERDGVPCYQLKCDADTELRFCSNALRRVALHSVAMHTVDASKNTYLFAIQGILDFHVWKGKTGNFDAFSYGTSGDCTGDIEGLAFSNLELIMEDKKPLYLRIANSRLDVQNSFTRPKSLFPKLKLQLTAMIEGTQEPLKMGFVPVLTDASINALEDKKWFGLRSKVSLGTLGEMAGKISLVSEMLIAWTVEGEESELYVGLKLPGTGQGGKMFSLQNVLKLSLGQLSLYHTGDTFVLMISDIAIKIFGIMKLPPNGNTMFYLFGPQQGETGNDLGWFALYKK